MRLLTCCIPVCLLNVEGQNTKSPTPIWTSTEQEAQKVSSRQQIESKLFQQFQQILQGSNTQNLQGALDDLSNNPTHPVQPEESDPEVSIEALHHNILSKVLT